MASKKLTAPKKQTFATVPVQSLLSNRTASKLSPDFRDALLRTIGSENAIEVPMDGRSWPNIAQSLYSFSATRGKRLHTRTLNGKKYAWLEEFSQGVSDEK